MSNSALVHTDPQNNAPALCPETIHQPWATSLR